jgi:ubiquinone/menaquinone biosynthesis C-methylase UbiE
MKDEDFIKHFKKDCNLYDLEKKELSQILSYANCKPNQTLIDIGAGIGRLSVPLSQHVKVTSVEPNKALLNEIKKDDILKINKKIEDYFPESKFDFALIAWPQFDEYHTIFKHIKHNVLKKDGQLILIKSKQHSLRKITKMLFPDLFSEGKKLLKILPEYFETIKEKFIETGHLYPDIENAFKLMKFEIEVFYGKIINQEQEKVLFEFVKRNENGGKVFMSSKSKIRLCGSK